eukprot:9038817-Lingulodinium_polyedra.AAC.1
MHQHGAWRPVGIIDDAELVDWRAAARLGPRKTPLDQTGVRQCLGDAPKHHGEADALALDA